MMTRLVSLLVFLAVAFPGSSSGQQTARQTYHDYRVGYLEYLPPEYASAEKTFPLLIFLHGGGEVGDGSAQSLSKVKAWGPPSFLDNYELCFPIDGEEDCFIVLSPQLNPELFDWVTTVRQLLDHVFNGPDGYKVDRDRVYLTGLSHGGLGAYQYAASFSNQDNQLAAIAPMSAWSENPLEACIIAERKIAVWAFHGKLDTVVPHSLGESAFRLIEKCDDPAPGAELIFTTYPDRYHDAWIPAYDPSNAIHSPNLYEWLLTKKRTPPDPPDPTTSVSEAETKTAWSVFPNPAADEIRFSSPNLSPGLYDVTILSATGEVVMEHKTNSEIDIRDLPAGLYILRAEVGGVPVNSRFIKAK